MNYFIITYGCQMNRSDSERIAAVLEKMNYEKALKINEADLILVNMCSVRQSAVDRVYGLLPKFKKLQTTNYKLQTILTGCILKSDLKKFKNKFDFILPIKVLFYWPKFLKKAQYFYYPNPREEKFNEKFNAYYLKEKQKYSNNFSAYVPIMTGCNNFCSFCVVPYVRGPEISRPAEEILSEIKNLIKRGFKEIWLLGQNVNSYLSDKQQATSDKEVNFPKLLKMVDDIEGNFWIRFTSSHPRDFSDELINVMAKCEKVTEYLNLPVQSGDNEILKRMNRPYIIEQYKNIVKKIRKKIPEISLSTDVIVGFPGETEKQFQNTAKLFKEIRFDMAYIARYSPRAGTTAAKFKDDVPPQEKKRRWKTLTEILKEATLEKNKKYIGKEVEVLVNESRIMNNESRIFLGKTRTYKTVKVQSTINNRQLTIKPGQFAKVKIIDALPWGLRGILI
ncbi:tRNA (N6-isopentenyl adenosine(37)-C2)-methylthiotransferase MiaB [Patescibacteria group bacterium]|nr:tRNA (N6-isopentenyl adenosine(37)-C2)-methylthiotransferase MiaB [Patescibacteria group bacterium]